MDNKEFVKAFIALATKHKVSGILLIVSPTYVYVWSNGSDDQVKRILTLTAANYDTPNSQEIRRFTISLN